MNFLQLQYLVKMWWWYFESVPALVDTVAGKIDNYLVGAVQDECYWKVGAVLVVVVVSAAAVAFVGSVVLAIPVVVWYAAVASVDPVDVEIPSVVWFAAVAIVDSVRVALAGVVLVFAVAEDIVGVIAVVCIGAFVVIGKTHFVTAVSENSQDSCSQHLMTLDCYSVKLSPHDKQDHVSELWALRFVEEGLYGTRYEMMSLLGVVGLVSLQHLMVAACHTLNIVVSLTSVEHYWSENSSLNHLMMEEMLIALVKAC